MSSIVAIVKSRPETVIEDIHRLMEMAEYRRFVSPENHTLLKVNISWQKFFPACSSTPWQLDGVVQALLADGFSKDSITACHNGTVVVDAKVGEVANKHRAVVEKHGIKNCHLEEQEWIDYHPKAEMLVLDQIYPKGFQIPKPFLGTNIIHLPTMKTHVFTTMTGAMKNAFGGLLNYRRHWTHSVIHETLVDLLAIQKDIHRGLFAVMDGSFAGDGPGPRCMVPSVKGYLLASADQVAIDAVSAKMMGFDPMEIGFIRIAHERGLGCGDLSEIEVRGEDVCKINFHFLKNGNTLASRGQHLIYHGALKPLEYLLLRTPLVPWSYLASRVYHDAYWYPFIGRKRVKEMLDTPWGKLFEEY